MAGHREHGTEEQKNILVRTIDGVGGYTGMQFFECMTPLYLAMLGLLPAASVLFDTLGGGIAPVTGGLAGGGSRGG